MTNKQNQINKLLQKLEELSKKQDSFSIEINQLRKEISELKSTEQPQHVEPEIEYETAVENMPVQEHFTEQQPTEQEKPRQKGFTRSVKSKIAGGVCAGLAKYFGINTFLVRFLWVILSIFFGIGFLVYIILWIAIPKEQPFHPYQEQASPIRKPVKKTKPKISLELEKFIGENLISKIAIVIIIIGVVIGVKYSIENDLISPLTRIILGYLVGLALLVVGIKLKKNYESFSAVLVSGAIAIMYFITYAAYSFYALYPQEIAFTLMVVLTVFSVIAALNYNKQIIAHIGLVGAYAIPFLLSDNSGNVKVLFSYMSIINIGILVISIKKYWKPLYISSFVLTWLIVSIWYVSSYNVEAYFGLALFFISIFFITFYAAFLSFKLIQKEQFNIVDILLLLLNSFIYYGFGYLILNSHEIGTQFLGVFTLCNALLHFIISVVIYKQKLGDKNLFYLVSGLVLVFITITIPVQLDGNWVTLLWVGEAALLFWIGRTKNISIYENISYALMILALFSIYQDWSEHYNLSTYSNNLTKFTPIFNIHFLTSIIFIGAFAFIYKVQIDKKYKANISADTYKIISFVLPIVLISTIYFSFFNEIKSYWTSLYNDSVITTNDGEIFRNYDLLDFRTIWILNYSMFYCVILSFLNMKKIKNQLFGKANLVLNTLVIFLFLVQGLQALKALRRSYLEQDLGAYYEIDYLNIAVKYISFSLIALVLYACYKYIRKDFMKLNLKIAFDSLLHITILWITSTELILWLDLSSASDSDKLGLSIFWGIYSLILISLGIWKNKKHLRIGAIGLFSITLIKLFFYDISHLSTLSKTIVFLSLGVLLLIISFLYNKFKNRINDEDEA